MDTILKTIETKYVEAVWICPLLNLPGRIERLNPRGPSINETIRNKIIQWGPVVLGQGLWRAKLPQWLAVLEIKFILHIEINLNNTVVVNNNSTLLRDERSSTL